MPLTKNIFYSVLLLLCLFSCRKRDKLYDFVIKNETGFSLDKIEFDFCRRDPFTKSIDPNAESEVFSMPYKPRGATSFGRNPFCVRVVIFSDSTGQREDPIGHQFDRKIFHDGTNLFIIRKNADTTSREVFEIVFR
jgi:hypothetical protein